MQDYASQIREAVDEVRRLRDDPERAGAAEYEVLTRALAIICGGHVTGDDARAVARAAYDVTRVNFPRWMS